MNILRPLIDFILPPRCYGCGDVLDEHQQLCVNCWKSLNFISKPLCECCGYPFSYEVSEGALCGHCAHKLPPYDVARAVFYYDEGSKPLILKFKHGDALYGAGLLEEFLSKSSQDVVFKLENPIVTPIPLHWTRLFKRMYNQSAVLAQKLSQRNAIEYVPNLLLRQKMTPYLGNFGRDERKKILKGAFTLNPKHAIKKRDILLIDDVHTTGATLSQAAKILKSKGARRVGVLTLARVVNPYKM